MTIALSMHPLTTTPLEPVTFGRYRLLGRIGAGGMAEVWAGELRSRGGFCKRVVVKRIRPGCSRDPEWARMFETEARIAARLAHPNICEVFELGDVDGELYMALELLRGASLRSLLREGGALTPGQVAGLIEQAGAGLHHAHELRDAAGAPLGVVHRDVSPENLFVTVDGVAKLLDFGIAKIADRFAIKTLTGKTKGKLAYIAPEQLAGEPIDRRADVWALGVVMWEALTGHRLFSDRHVEAARQIHAGEIPSLAAYGIWQPQLELVVRTALARDPAHRYPTVDALCAALRGAVAPGELATPTQLAALVQARCARAVAEVDQLYIANADTVARSRESLPASLLAAASALIDRDPPPPGPPAAAGDDRVATFPDRPAIIATAPDRPADIPRHFARAATIRVSMAPVATAPTVPVIPAATVPVIPVATVPAIPISDAAPAPPAPPGHRPTALLRLSQRLTLRHAAPQAPRARAYAHVIARAVVAALVIGLGLYAIDAATAAPTATHVSPHHR
ncbi:MAG: serine/threonine protein kinase [Myxococcales bacterium]|nr:serine/threonine protein kinase [Myxococcales bacterium]MBP6842616.1 serine/threonine protein kinase [Kofleriaceae bacterium]